jgi:hypothetical protein
VGYVLEHVARDLARGLPGMPTAEIQIGAATHEVFHHRRHGVSDGHVDHR